MDRYVWLHGFASGPQSSKGQYVRARLEERGVHLVIPDLNEPSFFEMTVSRMLDQVDVIAQGDGPLVLFGSSLGGFTAAHWAAKHPERMKALILLAPAFGLAQRWMSRMPAKDVKTWRETGRFAFDHYARGRKEDLSYVFAEDALRYDPFPLPQCPTLDIHGTQDEVVDPELSREFARRMGKRVQHIELPQGHELNADLPALWTLISDFLANLQPGPAR